LAFDGDGDRLGVVTRDGQVIYPDRQLMLFAGDVLSRHRGASILFDVKCSMHLAPMIRQLEGKEVIALHFRMTSPDTMRSAFRGIAIACGEATSYFIPVSPGGSSGPPGLPEAQVLAALEPLLTGTKPEKAGHDLKNDCVVLLRHGIVPNGITFDTMLGSYLLDPGRGAHTLERMTEEFLNESLEPPQDAGGSGDAERGETGEKPLEEAARACARSSAALRLLPVIMEKLEEGNQESLFRKLEMPLVGILAKMEHRGILVDARKLHALTRDFEKTMEEKATVIYDLAKEEFNIQSPRQLASILFDKLGLPVVKKTKTGPSTDVSVLEELALHHPIVEHVMTYRSLAKLKGTYADALPSLVHPETGRIHTSYNQTVTATGRLSSSEPNLQNIPIRTEEGRRIREAFVASPGHWLLSADYSQIELRILAHFSEDPHLVEAFQVDADVHQRTAAEMLNIPPHEVTPEMRRQAKTINFGIIYGMGPYGLARRLRISNKTAKVSIEKYFDRYSGVKRYIDTTVE
ncbi:MAG: DNA polymerase I, partial [Syntrophobacteraceae bacterium]|nr:DNA polymerase I [Syntrophobacteraceae bacterium]